jgi:hypothetical protein
VDTRALRTHDPVVPAWLGLIVLYAQAEPANGIVTIREHYHLLDKGVRRVGRNHILFVNQEHLARLLTKAGLAAVAWYGDWASRDFSPTSNEIIVVTRRATLAAPASNQRETAKP